MIARSLPLRHGRVAIPRPSRPTRQWRRSLSSATRRLAQEQDEVEYDQITADYEFFQHKRALTKKVGASIAPHYRPNELLRDPPRPQDITLELLLAAQTHLGHRTSLWHPANSRYIFGVWGQQHDAIHVISLDVTAAHLRRACKVVEGVAARGGLILFVGTRDGQAQPVVRAAKLAGGYHLFDKWTPGTLTNAEQILGRCRKMVVNELDQEVLGFESQLPTRAAIKPDLVVCLNPLENYVLLHECGIHSIPTIGIIDTDVNPTWVTYPIPANDDSLRSVTTIAGALGRAGEAGQALRRARAADGHVDYVPARDLSLPSRDDIQAAKRRREQLANADFDEDDDVLLSEAEEAIYAETQEQKLRDDEMAPEEPLEADEALLGDAHILHDQIASRSLTQDEQTLLQSSRTNELDSAAHINVLKASEDSKERESASVVPMEAGNEDAEIAFAQAASEVPVEKVREAKVIVEEDSFPEAARQDVKVEGVQASDAEVAAAFANMMRDSVSDAANDDDVSAEQDDVTSAEPSRPDKHKD